jgi:hypothetical protein
VRRYCARNGRRGATRVGSTAARSRGMRRPRPFNARSSASQSSSPCMNTYRWGGVVLAKIPNVSNTYVQYLLTSQSMPAAALEIPPFAATDPVPPVAIAPLRRHNYAWHAIYRYQVPALTCPACLPPYDGRQCPHLLLRYIRRIPSPSSLPVRRYLHVSLRQVPHLAESGQ